MQCCAASTLVDCIRSKPAMAAALDAPLPKPLAQPHPSPHLLCAHPKRFERQLWGKPQCRGAARLSRGGGSLLPLLPPVAAAAAGGAAMLPQPDEDERQRVALLDWLVRSQGAEPSCLKVERRWRDEAFGWCLVATTDIEPEEVTEAHDILSDRWNQSAKIACLDTTCFAERPAVWGLSRKCLLRTSLSCTSAWPFHHPAIRSSCLCRSPLPSHPTTPTSHAGALPWQASFCSARRRQRRQLRQATPQQQSAQGSPGSMRCQTMLTCRGW